MYRPEYDVLCANTMHHCMNVSFCLCVHACCVVSILVCVCLFVCMHVFVSLFCVNGWTALGRGSAAYLIVFQEVNRPVHIRLPGRPVVSHFGSHGSVQADT